MTNACQVLKKNKIKTSMLMRIVLIFNFQVNYMLYIDFTSELKSKSITHLLSESEHAYI